MQPHYAVPLLPGLLPPLGVEGRALQPQPTVVCPYTFLAYSHLWESKAGPMAVPSVHHLHLPGLQPQGVQASTFLKSWFVQNTFQEILLAAENIPKFWRVPKTFLKFGGCQKHS